MMNYSLISFAVLLLFACSFLQYGIDYSNAQESLSGCSLYDTMEVKNTLEKNDPVVKAFLEAFPNSKFSSQGVDESDTPKVPIIYEINDSGNPVEFRMDVREVDPNTKKCFWPTTYLYQYKIGKLSKTYSHDYSQQDNMVDFLKNFFLSKPHEQLNQGVELQDIQCKEGLILVVKSDYSSAACVLYVTGKKLVERGWGTCFENIFYGRGNPCGPRSSPGINFDSEQESEPEAPGHPRTTESEKKLYDARRELEAAYYETVNLGNSYIKDVIVGFGTNKDTFVIDIPLRYMEQESFALIKQDVRHIVGNDVEIDFVVYDEPIGKKIETVIPYLWNNVLHQKGIEFNPNDQPYLNNADGFKDPDRVCSPIIASNGTEIYISSTFNLEPFEITGTYIDKKEPEDCHKVWKTESLMVEPDRITALWLKNQQLKNEN